MKLAVLFFREKTKKFLSSVKKLGTVAGEDVKSLENELIRTKEKAEDLKQNKLAASTKYIAKIEETLKRSTVSSKFQLLPNT